MFSVAILLSCWAVEISRHQVRSMKINMCAMIHLCWFAIHMLHIQLVKNMKLNDSGVLKSWQSFFVGIPKCFLPKFVFVSGHLVSFVTYFVRLKVFESENCVFGKRSVLSKARCITGIGKAYLCFLCNFLAIYLSFEWNLFLQCEAWFTLRDF